MGKIHSLVTVTNKKNLSANFESAEPDNTTEPTVTVTSHNLADDGTGVWRGTGTYEAFRGDGAARVWEVNDSKATFAVKYGPNNIVEQLSVTGNGVEAGVKGAFDATGKADATRPGTTVMQGVQNIGQGQGNLAKVRPPDALDTK